MPYRYLVIIFVMLAAGVVGGLLSPSLRRNEKDEDPSANVPWWQSLLAGVVASFMVPLFLNMISSDLLSSMTGGGGAPGDEYKVFVFAGFCLVAAVSSNAFIGTLSAKVLGQVRAARRELRQVRNEVEPIIEKETEKEPTETAQLSVSVGDTMPLGQDEQKVLRELANGKWTLRTRTGIAAETGIAKEVVDRIVEELAADGLAGKVRILAHGKPKTRWHITAAGRSMVDRLTRNSNGNSK